MRVDLDGLRRPGLPTIGKVADKLFFLGVYADDGKPRREKLSPCIGYLVELCVAIRVGWARETFTISEE